MSRPAEADPDLPGGGTGDHCGSGESHGFFLDIHECRSGNGLFYRLLLGENIEFDIHPDRVLLRHGSVKMEVQQDKIVTHAPMLEHHGDLHVAGKVTADEDVVAGAQRISLLEHRHRYSYISSGHSRTDEPETPNGS